MPDLPRRVGECVVFLRVCRSTQCHHNRSHSATLFGSPRDTIVEALAAKAIWDHALSSGVLGTFLDLVLLHLVRTMRTTLKRREGKVKCSDVATSQLGGPSMPLHRAPLMSMLPRLFDG